MPFGMVVASPDTYPAIRGGFHNGYNFDDDKLVGFSHLRMTGVGCTGLGGHLSLLPLASPPTSSNPEAYAQRMDKTSETGSPDYYAVTLRPSGILGEITSTLHTSVERYTFPPGATNFIRIDLNRGASGVLAADMEQLTSDCFVGSFTGSMMCSQNGFYKIYFDMEGEQPARSVEVLRASGHTALTKIAGTDIILSLNLPPNASIEAVEVKIGFSTVDTDDATKALHKKVPAWDFDAVRTG